MKQLEIRQMESLQGGDLGCAVAVVGLVAGFIGLATLTAASGGLAVGAAVVGFNAASAGTALACGDK